MWWIRTSKQREKEKLYTSFGESAFDQLEDFQSFYNRFQVGLSYQLEHIDFPIPIFLGTYSVNMKTVYLEKDLWQDLGLALNCHKFLSSEKMSGVHRKIIEFDEGDIEVHLQDAEMNIMIDFQFDKNENEWRLIGIDDFSR